MKKIVEFTVVGNEVLNSSMFLLTLHSDELPAISQMIIRALSLDEVSFKDIFKVMWKEFRTGVISGLSLAGVCFVKLLLFDRIVLGNDALNFTVCVVISLTILVETICAKIIGSTLPIIAKKMGLDPAVLANPFITTISDVVSLLVYIGFAVLILGI